MSSYQASHQLWFLSNLEIEKATMSRLWNFLNIPGLVVVWYPRSNIKPPGSFWISTVIIRKQFINSFFHEFHVFLIDLFASSILVRHASCRRSGATWLLCFYRIIIVSPLWASTVVRALSDPRRPFSWGNAMETWSTLPITDCCCSWDLSSPCCSWPGTLCTEISPTAIICSTLADLTIFVSVLVPGTVLGVLCSLIG